MDYAKLDERVSTNTETLKALELKVDAQDTWLVEINQERKYLKWGIGFIGTATAVGLAVLIRAILIGG